MYNIYIYTYIYIYVCVFYNHIIIYVYVCSIYFPCVFPLLKGLKGRSPKMAPFVSADRLGRFFAARGESKGGPGESGDSSPQRHRGSSPAAGDENLAPISNEETLGTSAEMFFFALKTRTENRCFLVGNWLVVWNMNFTFHFIYGMSSFPLTNAYFSRWLQTTNQRK